MFSVNLHVLFISNFVFLNVNHFIFRLRDELNRSNEQIEEYRHLIYLINEKNLSPNLDDSNRLDYFDEEDDDDLDDCRPIEKNFCLDDHGENNFIFLYSKPSVSTDGEIDHLSILSHLEHEIT